MCARARVRERETHRQRDLTDTISQCKETDRQTDTEPTTISRSHEENQAKAERHEADSRNAPVFGQLLHRAPSSQHYTHSKGNDP